MRTNWQRRACNAALPFLHAHILAMLMAKPQVVLDNNYGKVSSFVKAWTGGLSSCRLVAEPATAIARAEALVALAAGRRPAAVFATRSPPPASDQAPGGWRARRV